MKRLLLLALILIALYLSIPFSAYAEEVTFDDVLSTLISAIEGDELNENLSDIWRDFDFEGETLEEKIKFILSGDFSLNYKSVFSAIFSLIFSGLKSLLPIMVAVCFIALLYALVKTLNPDFLSEETNKILYFTCYCAILSLLIYKTFSVVKNCFEGMESYAKQMDLVFPILLTVMTATGSNVTASVYRPAVAFLGAGITNVITSVVLPIIVFLIVFSSVSGISKSLKIDKLASFFGSVIKWILGISVTVFTIFLSIQGLTAGMYDGITLRITKYTIGNGIPIVGGFLKDGVDLFLAGGLLIKNALGICGIILLLGIILSPIIELISFMLFLKFCAGIIEPFTDGKMSEYMYSLSKNLNFVLASVLIVCFMYVVTVILLICTGGALI